MMATLDLSLAWSVDVPVETLGAHLQAYVELQPTINTLRLCNRFGQGPQAAITRLPVELVAEIEGYLMDNERAKQLDNWSKDFKCFQGLCKPIDHLSDSEQVGIWRDLFDECDYCGGRGCSGSGPETELNERQRKALENFLEDMMQDEGPEDSSWFMEHENRMTRWQGKTGAPTEQSRGLLSNYSALLLRNFGLQLWVTHTQPKTKKPGQWTAVDVYSSTVAYLTLPCDKVHHTFDRAWSESRSYSDGLPFLATESGGGVSVATPGELSAADFFRFSRAVKMLGLKPTDNDGGKTFTVASLKDDEAGTDDDAAAVAKADGGKVWAPKLRMLYSQAVDQEY